MKYRDLIRRLQAEGWILVRTVGSHQQYRHPIHPGTITVPAGGKMSRDIPAGTLNSVLRQAGLKMRLTMEYVVIIEKANDGSYSAYVPDLPGCVTCGDTVEEAKILIEEAIRLHIDSLRRHQEPVPVPTAVACSVRA